MAPNRVRIIPHVFSHGLHKGLVRIEFFVRCVMMRAQCLKRRQVQVEIPKIEAIVRTHIDFIEDQILLNQAWALERKSVCHDER